MFPFYGPCYSQWKSSDGASSSALYLYSDIHPRQLGNIFIHTIENYRKFYHSFFFLLNFAAVVSMTGQLNVTLLTSADLALASQGLTVPSRMITSHVKIFYFKELILS